MPPKGSKKAETTPTSEDTSMESPEEQGQQTGDKISPELDNRLSRIEKVLDALAARQEPEQQEPPQKKRIVTRQTTARKKNEDSMRDSLLNTEQEVSSINLEQPEDVYATASRQHEAAMPHAMTLGQHGVMSWRNASSPYVNNPSMAAAMGDWLLNKTPSLSSSLPFSHAPMSAKDFMRDDSIDARVQQILSNSVSNTMKGTSPSGLFPFKYVARGPEHAKANINSLTAIEHLWGIFAMIKDLTVPSDIKPYLLNHMDEVLDDARSYDWESAVRPWSEEVFSLIAEGRLQLGWADSARIQMLRMTISRAFVH